MLRINKCKQMHYEHHFKIKFLSFDKLLYLSKEKNLKFSFVIGSVLSYLKHIKNEIH